MYEIEADKKLSALPLPGLNQKIRHLDKRIGKQLFAGLSQKFPLLPAVFLPDFLRRRSNNVI